MQKEKKKKLKPVKNSSSVCFSDSEELRAEFREEDAGKGKVVKKGEDHIEVRGKSKFK